MISSPGFHSAPSGLVGALPSDSGSAGTRAVYAMRDPSGDQAMLPGASGKAVMLALAPFSSQRTCSSGPPPLSVET